MSTENTVPVTAEHNADKSNEEVAIEHLEEEIKENFRLEILKNGCILATHKLNKSQTTFGRSRECDFPLDHPSISRVHATLIWRKSRRKFGSFYLLDSSTHGTILNKKRIPSGIPVELEPGNNVFTFGGSTRLFMLNSLEEPLNEVQEEPKPKESEAFCAWGMSDENDVVDESENEPMNRLETVLMLLKSSCDTFTSANDHAYKENPQKTLQQWFEREGYEYEYRVDCQNGRFKCTFELPIEGQDVLIDGKTHTKKKDAIADTCLKACYILDKAELLFPWQQQRASAFKRANESSSEEDVYDETEQTKQKKARKLVKKSNDNPDTFETLCEKLKKNVEEMQAVALDLEKSQSAAKSDMRSTHGVADSLDAFMQNLGSDKSDGVSFGLSVRAKIERSKLRMKLKQLELEQKRLHRLLKIASPGCKLQNLTASVKEETNANISLQSPGEIKLPSQIKDEELGQSSVKETVEVGVKSTDTTSEIIHDLIKVNAAEIAEKCEEPKVSKQDKEKAKRMSTGKGVGDILKSERKLNQDKQQKFFDKEKYVEWQPPMSQTGDGRTALNEKFGY